MKKIMRSIRNQFYIFLYYIFRILPVKKNKIFAQNFNGKGCGDNPKYIVEEFFRRGADVDIVWAVKPDADRNFPQAVRTIAYKSIRAVYEEATAGIWIDNCRKQPYVRKRKEQYYIQTWHGGPNYILKKTESDAAALDPYYTAQAKRDSLMVDLFLTCEKGKNELIEKTFWYTGELLESGSPVYDLYFTENYTIKENVCRYFNVERKTKFILYAPTFRDKFDPSVFDLDYRLILERLSAKTNEKWVFLVRLHPEIAQKADFMTYTNDILNASNYDDVQELIFASDILISDYSGVITEFAVMKKPVFLYTKDYASYIHERGFYMDLFSLPFPIAMSNEELINNINSFDSISYQKELAVFFQKTGLLDDGKASKRVVDRILAELKKRA